MFTTTQILLAAGLILNVGAIAVVGVALRRAVRRYRNRPAAAADVRATAAATAVVDLSQEPTVTYPVAEREATDPWEGTPPPPAWEVYVSREEAAPRYQVTAVEPGTGRRVIPRRNAAPAAAEPVLTVAVPVSPAPVEVSGPIVVEEDGTRYIELILTPIKK